MSQLFARVALAGALTLAMAVAACGRKGALDLPPSASAVPSPAASSDQSEIGLNPLTARREQSASDPFTSEGQPIPPKGQKKRLPIDWLLD